MTTPEPGKTSFNLRGAVILVLVGMVGGTGLTLWGVKKFGTPAAPVVNAPSPEARMGTASPRVAPQGEPGTGVPGVLPQAKAVATQVSNNNQFRFALQSCRTTESGVFCELMITNLTDKDINFVLNGGNNPRSLAYTDKGLEFSASNVVLGSRSGSFYAEQTLVSQVPTPMTLLFRQMPQTPQLTLLKIGYRYRSLETGQWMDETVEFRPVPLIL